MFSNCNVGITVTVLSTARIDICSSNLTHRYLLSQTTAVLPHRVASCAVMRLSAVQTASGGLAPFIFTLRTKCSWLVSCTVWLLNTPEIVSRYPLNGRLFGPQSRSGGFGEEKPLLLLPGIEPRFLGYPADRLVCQKFYFSVFHATLHELMNCITVGVICGSERSVFYKPLSLTFEAR